MNTKSAKAKGRKLQNFIRDELRYTFKLLTELQDDDIKSQTMGMTGEDIVLSPAAKQYIDFSFECKNVEKLNLWASLKQCEDNTPDNKEPALVFTRNHAPVYVTIPWEKFRRYLEKDIYEEVPDEDLWEDGERSEEQVEDKINYHVLREGDWLLMRRRTT